MIEDVWMDVFEKIDSTSGVCLVSQQLVTSAEAENLINLITICPIVQ